MADAHTVVAVDFGATSIRVCLVDLATRPVGVDIVHRVAHEPVADASGTLRWDWERLVAEMYAGLERAIDAGPVASIGIDTWGVDYGLLDEHGELLEPPISYRDRRTAGYRTVVERIGEERLYEIAGLQLLPINTIFQLAAHDRAVLDRARHLLMLPELLANELTGVVTGELTSAGTTGLLDLSTRAWSDELCHAIDLDPAVLPDLAEPGTAVGSWRGVPVHLVGGHDTASGVLAGGAEGAAFVSAGTWLLVGRERDEPDRSEWARRRGFTNELGAAGGVRFLRNVAGWWLVEECRRSWDGVALEDLLAGAAEVGDVPVADATDERFLSPRDMAAELRDAAGLPVGASRAEIVRCAVESMAAATAAVVADLPETRSIRLFGGGTRSALLIDALARRSGLPVSVGPVEATALGNALVQGLAAGAFASVAEARRALAFDEERSVP